MDEIELVQVDCKTEAESSSDEEVYYLLAEPSLLEERDEREMIVISESDSDVEMTIKEDVGEFDYPYETAHSNERCQEQCLKYWA